MATKRKFSKEFKIRILNEIRSGRSQAEVSRQYELHPQMVSRWQSEFETYGEVAFSGNGKSTNPAVKVLALEKKIARLEAENNLLKKALTQLDAIREGYEAGETE